MEPWDKAANGVDIEEILRILTMEGIVIRLIPKYTKLIYDEKYCSGKPNQKIFYCEERKRNFCEELKENSLGGKYIVSFDVSQGSTIIQNLKTCGVGNTLAEAYQDFFDKI